MPEPKNTRMNHPKPVMPGAGVAAVADNKITDYLLNPTHPKGAGKATFFVRFGFSLANPAELKKALLDHPLNNPVTKHTVTPYGERYVITCSLATPDGRNPCIITVWDAEPTNPNPRLVTAYANPL